MFKRMIGYVWDASALAGVAMVCYGLAGIYAPLAWLWLGAIALTVGTLGAKRWA